MLPSLMGLSARTTTRSYLLGSVSMGTLAHTGWSFVPSALSDKVLLPLVPCHFAPINDSGLLGRLRADSLRTVDLA
jgi:hypothetical protein